MKPRPYMDGRKSVFRDAQGRVIPSSKVIVKRLQNAADIDCPEAALCLTVIGLAIQDAITPMQDTYIKGEYAQGRKISAKQRAAQRFLLSRNLDLWANPIGLDSDWLREQITALSHIDVCGFLLKGRAAA